MQAIKENENKLDSADKVIKKNTKPILDVQKTILLNTMQTLKVRTLSKLTIFS